MDSKMIMEIFLLISLSGVVFAKNIAHLPMNWSKSFEVSAETTLSTTDQLRNYETHVSSSCYFPAELQGEFMMQVSGKNAKGSMTRNEPIQYSPINITYNAIPVWGVCYKKVGNNVLLIDSYSDCIRCFRLERRSRNVVEVFSENINKCYTSEIAAIESCGTLNATSILYRTKDIGGAPITYEYCPIAGRYHFRYDINEGTEEKFECNSYSSDFDTCPVGSVIHLQFKRCSFDSFDITFNCLGSWEGPNGARYIALEDTKEGGGFRPQYRCGLFYVDNKKGKTYLAFSSDSSCTQNLMNATMGYENLVLTKATNQKTTPTYVKTHLSSFPKWAQGEWEESLVIDGTMTFIDRNGYNSFTFIAVDSNHDTGRYVVYSKDHCEREAFACMLMRQRSENVMEFATGLLSSPIYQPNLCDNPNFDKPVWMTQARIERTAESPCPITGQYTGEIVDIPGMCAELSSNCQTREIMYFKVSDCNTGELYEERSYLCLGQWEENGVMYTYTMRNDTKTKECFVGLIINDEEIYIKEAGDHCIRNIIPKEQGMRLYKKGQCYGNSPSPAPTPMRPTIKVPSIRHSTTYRPRSQGPTRMPPRVISSSARSTKYSSSLPVLIILFTLSITLTSSL
ncbi:uncharacterized protein LOC122501008 [Leptopilina heterotoma]|uniref:uncharacterized protein LOC122501008 n=1 Tax=Leptopilina heterotoma TaxID=63436 RepID=UPI001CA863B3|nr:uncharacterized protein LOC122501008 [Leptopilina heterotoma]